MSLPVPRVGLVIRYSYLWHREHLSGKDEGSKDRPATIIASLGNGRVYVLPITHSRPTDDFSAVEIPPPIKRQIGLDDDPSWIIVSEYNVFTWPGADIRPSHDGKHKMLPNKFAKQVSDLLSQRTKAGKVRGIDRD